MLGHSDMRAFVDLLQGPSSPLDTAQSGRAPNPPENAGAEWLAGRLTGCRRTYGGGRGCPVRLLSIPCRNAGGSHQMQVRDPACTPQSPGLQIPALLSVQWREGRLGRDKGKVDAVRTLLDAPPAAEDRGWRERQCSSWEGREREHRSQARTLGR